MLLSSIARKKSVILRTFFSRRGHICISMFTLGHKIPVMLLRLANDPFIRGIVLKYLRKQRKRVPDVRVTSGLEKSNRET